jgi:uncharacterized protein
VNEKPLAVLDTQILLRAAINTRSLPAKIFFDLKQLYQLVASEQTIAEFNDVVHRPEILTKFPSLTDRVIAEALDLLATAQQITVDVVETVSRDPKDDIFLALAVESKAQYLVSEDKDLLVLDPYKGIRILNALDFLHILQARSSETNNS